jgi:hypothetical protein
MIAENARAIEPPPSPLPPIEVAATGPKLDFDLVKPPDPKSETIDPSRPEYHWIKNGLGIKTTVLDKSDALPAVFADSAKDPGPPVPKIDIDIAPPPLMAPRLDMPPAFPGLSPPASTFVSNRDVTLDFTVTRAGSSRIAAVELWTTRDGGRSWSCTDRMKGAQSPMRTRLGSEGIYGFRLVCENEYGLRSAEPQPGASPDVVVELDVSPPKMTPVIVEPAGKDGLVRLAWTVTDKHEDRSGSMLEYSADGCDWRPIEISRLQRSGSNRCVDWSVPAGMSPQLLFRATARDLAGNQSVAESPSKVTIDLVAPAGKITGVHSERDEPEIGPMPRMIGADDRGAQHHRAADAATLAIAAVMR